MMNFTNDSDLLSYIRKSLFTAVIGDVMDRLGFLNQFLPSNIRPLRSDMFIAGRAMTVLESDIDQAQRLQGIGSFPDKPFGRMFEALDDLKKDEVYICSGSCNAYALWGELMSTRAIQLGAAGAVLNGYSRDTNGILGLNFQTFSYGSYAQDQEPRGRVVDFRTPIQIGNVLVNDGDIVVGDIDGVCIIPRSVEKEVIELAAEKVSGEKMVQKAIIGGMSACEAYDRYGIM